MSRTIDHTHNNKQPVQSGRSPVALWDCTKVHLRSRGRFVFSLQMSDGLCDVQRRREDGYLKGMNVDIREGQRTREIFDP